MVRAGESRQTTRGAGRGGATPLCEPRRGLWQTAMEIVFGIVVVTVSLVAAAVAFLTYLRVGDLYRQIGRSYLTELDRGDSRSEQAGAPGSRESQAR